MILGTAGHIDHGKTTLVRALTGVDTDRLPEEKRRGITIELGFAPLTLDGLEPIGIVDVPGHDGFVRTMLAGATGMDLALLVIAADEGIMPQTREHLSILTLLGVQGGVVALTKCDAAEPDWMEMVEADVRELLAGGSLAAAPIVRCSTVTGEGLPELRAALSAAVRGVPARATDDVFRLPVDRAFSVKGTGTVVTGTVWSGSVAVEDQVVLLPQGREAPGIGHARLRHPGGQLQGVHPLAVGAAHIAPGIDLQVPVSRPVECIVDDGFGLVRTGVDTGWSGWIPLAQFGCHQVGHLHRIVVDGIELLVAESDQPRPVVEGFAGGDEFHQLVAIGCRAGASLGELHAVHGHDRILGAGQRVPQQREQEEGDGCLHRAVFRG